MGPANLFEELKLWTHAWQGKKENEIWYVHVDWCESLLLYAYLKLCRCDNALPSVSRDLETDAVILL